MNSKTGTQKILVLDDDPRIIKLISYYLEREGYELSGFSSSYRALEALSSIKPDLILCDVTMDELDGYEFCRIIKQDDNSNKIPFIFVTGKHSAEDKELAFSSGGDDVIEKPFHPKELVLKVKAALDK